MKGLPQSSPVQRSGITFSFLGLMPHSSHRLTPASQSDYWTWARIAVSASARPCYKGRDVVKKDTVLFLCTGNSARSQMAEGFLRHLGGDRFEVASAGTQPKGLNPHAIRVMKEVGIDISDHNSKDLSQFLGQHFSYVVTVCDNAKQTCPVFPLAERMLHWSLEDPANAQGSDEERLAVFRQIRDEIERHIREFMADPSLA